MFLFGRVRQVAADVLDVPVEKITLESSPQNIEKWDSIQNLNFLLALEQEFRLQFEPDEIDAMASIGKIVALLESKINGNP
jgi:acyl carrier protein